MKDKLTGYYRDQPLGSACWSYVILTILPGLLFPEDRYLAEALVRFLLPGAVAIILAVHFYGAGMNALSRKGLGKSLLLCSPVAVLCAVNLLLGKGAQSVTAPRVIWIFCGALSEELLARMLLFEGIRTGAAARQWSGGITIVLAGFIFGAMHAINYASQGVAGALLQCLYTAAVGTIFAWSYQKTGCLWGGIFWHTALNLTALS